MYEYSVVNLRFIYGADDKEGTYKEEYEQKIADLEAEKQQLRDAIDLLTARLSETGALRFTENNPYIVDLSDDNRHDKLAEQMSELYDNEWTNAFQHLTETEGLQDEETVTRLLNILKKIYTICLKFTRKQTEDLKKAILSYLGLSAENKDDVAVMETEKILREYRLTQLEPTLGCIIKDIKDQLKDELEGKVHNTVDKYIQKCTHLCWFMDIKTPQMHLDFDMTQRNETPGDDGNDFPSHFDTTKFVSYTKVGMYVEYIVWPALFLYKNGPIIKKGVAQGLNRKPEVQKPNVKKNGDTSSNIDDKSVIDTDQGQDGDNSKSDITKHKDEDDNTSICLYYAGDVVHNIDSEMTVHSNSPNIDGYDLSDGKQDDVSPYEDIAAKLLDEKCQDDRLSNATKVSKKDETFRSPDESDIEELIFGNDDNTEQNAISGFE
ncbi:hypothetical protein CHS0354_035478 [Potamilus streckersoni]|uniref:Mitochondria-eating protein C-terminal domain-containing protein n=1 Tax=Potamilus streckersoni TaxID=2493646 RepID=A0AAE0RVL3_9BIVA|nr:hypothetical protein CHS0354_035478 [Potamilus streckersoni]